MTRLLPTGAGDSSVSWSAEGILRWLAFPRATLCAAASSARQMAQAAFR